MKAAIIRDTRKIQLEEVDYLRPESGYLIIEMKSSGICGTDLHAYHRTGGFRGLAEGHELAGIVHEVGEGVVGFNPGDRVIAEGMSGCGECVYCKRGLYNVCQTRHWFWGNGHGGFADYTTAQASSVFKLPDTLSFEQGALVEPLAVGYRAMMISGATSQDRVVIIGGGSIGLLTLAAAKTIGVKETMMVVKYPQQVEIASVYGADHIINITDTNVQEYCLDVTAGMGVDVVIETTGSETAFNNAVKIVRHRGTVVLVGGYPKPVTVDLGSVLSWELTIKGTLAYSYSGMVNDFEATIELVQTGKVDPTEIVTHRLPFEEIVEAFRIADDKSTGSIKVNVYR